MVLPKPSLTLVLDIDERLDSKELRLEVDRCYSYVASTLVRTHAAGTTPEISLALANAANIKASKNEAASTTNEEATPEELLKPQNVVRFLVRIGTKKYLFSKDEGADELWNKVIEHWLYSEFYKVGNHLQIFNRRQREIGNPELKFDYFDIELEGGKVCAWMHLNSESSIDPEQNEQLSRFREKLNEGALGENLVHVIMPEPDNYEIQYKQGMIEKAEREAAEEQARKAAEEEERKAAEAAAQAADEAFLEAPEGPSEEELAFEKERAELEEKYNLKEPDFTIDYNIWRLEYADGSTKTYNSATDEFLA